MSRNLCCLVEYDGTNFFGFQKQSGFRTVQGELEQAVLTISGTETQVIGAGRTDRGVHASGQVINFHSTKPISPTRWLIALNGVLPDDVAVREVREVDGAFHARFSAIKRSYRYTLLVGPVPQPLRRLYAYRYFLEVQHEPMQEAAQLLLGEHDFSAFAHSPQDSNDDLDGLASCIRVMYEAKVERNTQDWQIITFDFTANAFLTAMVRRLVGTLLLVGRNKLTVTGFGRILAERKKTHPGEVVPSTGLCLIGVAYPE